MTARRAPGPGLALPIAASALLHLALAATMLLARPDAPVALPPVYRVDIVAAPPGPRREGVVTPTPPATPAPTPPAPPRRAETPERAMPAPTPARSTRTPPAPATPTPNPAPARTETTTPAGGGETGGRGTDVATVRTQGIEFPYPGYLNNIVRQIALNFRPRNASGLRADVQFLIHRDGRVSNVRFVTRSGSYAFDLECEGALEAAAPRFGPLPAGFNDDVLPVTFSFDPRLIR